jgi:hypothetical protein
MVFVRPNGFTLTTEGTTSINRDSIEGAFFEG